jgi:hypothetical protein
MHQDGSMPRKDVTMKRLLRGWCVLAALLGALPAMAQIVLYEHDNYAGRSVTLRDAANDFARFDFNDRASSAIVEGGPWEVCDDANFGGRCMILRPGVYPSLANTGLNDRLSSARPYRSGWGGGRNDSNRWAPEPMAGQIVFYEHDNFQGRQLSLDNDAADFERVGFNDIASSIVVYGHRWEACEHRNYGGRCVVLRPGRYPSLAAVGLNDRLSSVRRIRPADHVDEGRYAPIPGPVMDGRRVPMAPNAPPDAVR